MEMHIVPLQSRIPSRCIGYSLALADYQRNSLARPRYDTYLPLALSKPAKHFAALAESLSIEG
jgi:hypothetical protein